LAELAAEVASGSGDREGRGSRKEMEKRLLLHRVHVHGAGIAVHQAVILSPAVFPDPAKSPPSFGNDTLPRAELALNLSILQELEMRRKLLAEKTFFPLLGGSGGRIPGNRPEESAAGRRLEEMASG